MQNIDSKQHNYPCSVTPLSFILIITLISYITYVNSYCLLNFPLKLLYFPLKDIPYIVPNNLFLILRGDIELIPGPTRTLLCNYPLDHKLRHRTYFTPKTIQLRPEYLQLSNNFTPHLISTHPHHQKAKQTHPFLVDSLWGYMVFLVAGFIVWLCVYY
jgi:hypothetical protein